VTDTPPAKKPYGKLALAAAALVFTGALAATAWRARQSESVAPVPGVAIAATVPGSPEARVGAHPDDPAAWRTLGDSRFAAQDFPGAVEAFEHAVTLAPGEAGAWSALGEARVMASPRDPMPAPALTAFRRAAAIDAREPRARYFLAVNRDLGGDHAGAIADWLALLADTPPGAPWEADLRRTIVQVGKINRINVDQRLAAVRQPAPASGQAGAAAMPGPSADEVRAAAAIPPSQQQTMAETMVARFETRLRTSPANPDGWVMLMRSRMTLGQPDKASTALRDAVAANPAEADELRRQAAALGVH